MHLLIIISSDINRSLLVDHLMASIDHLTASILAADKPDPKEVLEEMERLTGKEHTSQSPDAETEEPTTT
jgi:hypothetical protein